MGSKRGIPANNKARSLGKKSQNSVIYDLRNGDIQHIRLKQRNLIYDNLKSERGARPGLNANIPAPYGLAVIIHRDCQKSFMPQFFKFRGENMPSPIIIP